MIQYKTLLHPLIPTHSTESIANPSCQGCTVEGEVLDLQSPSVEGKVQARGVGVGGGGGAMFRQATDRVSHRTVPPSLSAARGPCCLHGIDLDPSTRLQHELHM